MGECASRGDSVGGCGPAEVPEVGMGGAPAEVGMGGAPQALTKSTTLFPL